MTEDHHHNRVLNFFNEHDCAVAIILARRYLEDFPASGPLWQLYGTACWQLKDFTNALHALEHASLLTPLHPLAQYALAACYVWADRSELACLIYEHLGESLQDTARLASVAARLGALGRYKPALRVCRKITELDPAHHQAFFGIAYYLNRLDHSPEALVPSLAMAVHLAPHVPRYRVNLASIFELTGRLERAHELLEPVPLESVRCPRLLRRMREIFDRAGDCGRALMCQARLSCILQ